MPKLNNTRARIADVGKTCVVIIGGGFADLEVARGFRGADVEAVLFDKYNYHCFQPLLYQVATSALETNSIVFPFRKLFRKPDDIYFRLGAVNHIKPDENCIETSIGSPKWQIWMFIHLVSIVGFKNKFFVLSSWLWSYFSYDKSSRLIIARPKDGIN